MSPYSIIYADPPWHYGDRLPGPGRGAESHYPVMTDEDIFALPVTNIAADDCALFLWATGAKLDVAVDCVKRWGCRYVTVAFDWIKAVSCKPVFGMGRWTRSAHEFCLLGVRGKPQRVNASIRQSVIWPPQKHSAKPPIVRDRIVKLMGDVPRIELFARESVGGWDATGLDLDGRDIREVFKP